MKALKTVEEVAQSFQLKRMGHQYRGDCPLCQARKMELAVWEREGKLRCKCFYGGCDGQELFRLLVGLDGILPPAWGRQDVGLADSTRRVDAARRIWQETVNATGTLVERYLKGRGLSLEPFPTDLRFHPALWHEPSRQTLPAMVAAVRDESGEIRAVHRTFLDYSGRKAAVEPSKMSLAPIQGCAIRLAEAQEALGLAEGIETALSAQEMSGLPVWSAISAGNMRQLVLPETVREIVIFGDNGGAGEKAAQAAADIFNQEGLNVKIAFPPAGFGDFNDLLKGGMA